MWMLQPASTSTATATKLCGMSSTENACLTFLSSLCSSSYNVLKIPMGTYDGVPISTFGSCTTAVLHLAFLPSMMINTHLESDFRVYVLSVWGGQFFLSIFNFYAWFGTLMKGMGESFLLSEDEPLTLNIDGVMALWTFRKRAQTAKNWRNTAILLVHFSPNVYLK